MPVIQKCSRCGCDFNPKRQLPHDWLKASRCEKCGFENEIKQHSPVKTVNNKSKDNKSKRDRKLYLMEAGEYWKIGISVNPQSRKKSIQTGNPNSVKILEVWDVNGADEIESHLHKKFQEYKENGEWFAADEMDISDINEEIAGFQSTSA